MPYINQEEGNAHYQISGSGPINIVFLHGFLGNLTVWDRYVEDLDSSYTILRIDLAGHGNSSCLAETHTMELMAEQVYKVMEETCLTKAHFVGHSMGGYVSIAAAVMSPDRVETITLFNSTAAEDSPQKKIDRIRTIRVLELSHELFVSEAINNLFAPDNLVKFQKEVSALKLMGLATGLEGGAPALRGMALRIDQSADLKAMKIPMLFIAGVFDNIIPIDSVRVQAKQLNAQLLVLEKSGHMGFVEEYSTTLIALEEFWKPT